MALLEVRDLSVTFGAGATAVAGGEGRELRRSRAARPWRWSARAGSGKSVTALSMLQLLPYPHGRAPHRLASASRARSWSARRRASCCAVRGNRVSMIFQEPMTSLNPLHTIERQVNEVLILHKGLTREAARRAHARAAASWSAFPRPPKRARRLSAPALRRPAPAGDDRHGAGQRARPADRRRADHRARRHHPGADPEAAEEPAGAATAWRCCSSPTTSPSCARWPTGSAS